VSRPWVVVPAANRLVTERSDPGMVRLARLTMFAMTLVLLVACTNLSNLTLARGVSRRREMAVRVALGASRWQLVREQLVESAILTALGAGLAVLTTRVLIVYGASTTLKFGPWVAVDIAPALDVSAAIVALAAAAVALIVFGVLPALQLSGRTVPLVGAADGGMGSSARWSGRRLLIASQVAVSVALVAIAGLCVRQVAKAASDNAGIDLDRLALVRFDFAVQGWPEARARAAVTRVADAAARADANATVAVASGLPFRGYGRTASFTTTDRPFVEGKRIGHGLTLLAGTPSLFETLGVRIVAGRGFDARDTETSPHVVILSAAAASRLFNTTAVLGRDVLRQRRSTPTRAAGVDALTVVGVADDISSGPEQAVEGVAYLPFEQQYDPSLTIVARTPDNPSTALAALTSATRRLEPELGVIDAGTGRELRGVENVAFEIMAALSGLLGVAAMVLAMAGLYGVLSYVVAQRTHEIGVRVALGATTRQIMRLVLVDGVRPVVEGLAVGFVIADLAEMALRPAIQKPLPAIDATLMTLVPLPFLAAALIACYLPSRRAAAVDPNVALRHS
jgi:predicted permease